MERERSERRRTERRRTDPAVIAQHDRLAKRIVWSLLIMFVGLGVLLRGIQVTILSEFTTDELIWSEFGIYGLLAFLFGALLVVIFAGMIAHLPDGEDRTVSMVEQESKPAHMTIERVNGNQMRRDKLEWDLDEEEAEHLARAIETAGWVATRKIVKRGTEIRNVNDRYGAWMLALEKVGAVVRVGNRWEVTDDGVDILRAQVPRPT